LEKLGLQATLLDSSSTDDTVSIASGYSLVSVTKYDYSSHCRAYNEICTQLNGKAEYVMILDADMVVTTELWEEVKALISQSKVEVIKAPVLMYVEGHSLEFGSLCPPKAFVLKSGREYFTPLGHGEALVPGCAIAQTKAKLIHDDRKAYHDYLNSQYRYAQGLLGRAKSHSLSWKDRLRIGSPIMIFVTPFFSYFIKLGFMSGKAALLYALDRLIAEAVMFRQSVAEKLKEK
jgi:hypothetical protein